MPAKRKPTAKKTATAVAKTKKRQRSTNAHNTNNSQSAANQNDSNNSNNQPRKKQKKNVFSIPKLNAFHKNVTVQGFLGNIEKKRADQSDSMFQFIQLLDFDTVNKSLIAIKIKIVGKSLKLLEKYKSGDYLQIDLVRMTEKNDNRYDLCEFTGYIDNDSKAISKIAKTTPIQWNPVTPTKIEFIEMEHGETVEVTGIILNNGYQKRNFSRKLKKHFKNTVWLLQTEPRFAVEIVGYEFPTSTFKQNDKVQIYGTINQYQGKNSIKIVHYLKNVNTHSIQNLPDFNDEFATITQADFDYTEKYQNLPIIAIQTARNYLEAMKENRLNEQLHGFKKGIKLIKCQAKYLKFQPQSEEYVSEIGTNRKLVKHGQRAWIHQKSQSIVPEDQIQHRFRHEFYIRNALNIDKNGIRIILFETAAAKFWGMSSEQFCMLSNEEKAQQWNDILNEDEIYEFWIQMKINKWKGKENMQFVVDDLQKIASTEFEDIPTVKIGTEDQLNDDNESSLEEVEDDAEQEEEESDSDFQPEN